MVFVDNFPRVRNLSNVWIDMAVAPRVYNKLKGDDLDGDSTAEQECIASISQEAKRKANYAYPAAYFQEPDGTHIGIKKGEVLSLRVLLQGLLICSGNDAANVIAYTLGPTIPTYMLEFPIFSYILAIVSG